ncbi:hypothetical protein Dehly_0246 [Dehalogenimonas lykanthroporepellens BL-DC-9]|jgi:hypothetical protein|nr:hypothetical protein Dehly_0246 [Dehalogenimonas lykanthroporepellens BL-DC-9]
MNLLLREDLLSLLRNTETPAVSLYLATHRAGDTDAEPIRWRHLLDEAESRLTAAGLRAPVAREMLAEPRKFVNDALFWRYQEEGMVCFITPSSFRYFALPFAVPDMAVVGERFHVRPLLPSLESNGIYYLLTLSLNSVALFQCRRRTGRDIPLPEGVHNVAEANRHDDSEKPLQYHTVGKGPAVFHGQADPGDFNDTHVTLFLQKLCRELEKLLAGERAPLVVAGVENIRARFARECRYPNILPQGVEGNPDRMTPEKLRAAAWDTASAHFDRLRRERVTAWVESSVPGLAVNGAAPVALSAEEGRVSALFLAVDADVRGVLDRENRRVLPGDGPEAVDLVEYAVAQTLLHDGEVFVLTPEELPGLEDMAASLRY